MRFNVEVSTIKEMDNLNDLKMDQMFGTLTTYEMRVVRGNFEPKSITCKVSKHTEEHKDHQDYSNCESD